MGNIEAKYIPASGVDGYQNQAITFCRLVCHPRHPARDRPRDAVVIHDAAVSEHKQAVIDAMSLYNDAHDKLALYILDSRRLDWLERTLGGAERSRRTLKLSERQSTQPRDKLGIQAPMSRQHANV